MSAKSWIVESPHPGVKGEFVGKIGPSGWGAHETGYRISAGSNEGWRRARSDEGDYVVTG